MSAHFPKPKFFGTNVKVELYLYNYKNATGIDYQIMLRKLI